MALSAVDQLNNLETSTFKPRAMDYETYFGEMELSEEEIQERIELAEDLDDVFEYLFVLYLAMLKAGKKVDRDELVQTVLTRYRDVLYDNGLDIDERYPGMYGISQRSSESIVDTTIAYGALNDWYTSEDRAMFLAENEANTIANYEDLMDAIAAGYTTKTWVTMSDRKVRETHRDLEGVTISIFEPFDVGGYQMMVPKDDSMGAGPEEIVNCRCSMAWGGEMPTISSPKSMEKSLEYISTGKGKLNAHRKELLSRVREPGQWSRFEHNKVTLEDLAYLSASQGHEFALWTSKTDVILHHGTAQHCDVPTELQDELLLSRKYEFTAHTHVIKGAFYPSQDDRKMLWWLEQKESTLIDATTGKQMKYGQSVFDS